MAADVVEAESSREVSPAEREGARWEGAESGGYVCSVVIAFAVR